ncbi:probable glucan endo-1,3-beta-glucosidase BG1, partial [Carica papaya]|uniref:probable glucan endo-1,3-beta-glucosidase BG1 n=1 Tax=Carica papaya TaxID=3649 RepID=UPI000B8D05FA
AQIGVCYGRMADNLPPPAEVVALYKQNNITRMRMYSADQDVLTALRGSNIELVLDLPNSDLQFAAASQANADAWVNTNVKSYIDNVRIRYIAVGNEVKPSDPLTPSLIPAIKNIQNAVNSAGLSDRVKVSTATFMAFLGESYPPSAGVISAEYMPIMGQIINILNENKAPFLVNVYPYFSYKYNADVISLDYALLKPSAPINPDPPLQYNNLFDAMVDAVHSALEKAGGGSLEVVVTESGWPTAGDIGASFENAQTYNNNLIQHVKQGTPKKPGKPTETYLFAMFNERGKEPEVEKNWGLFFPNKEHKYPVNFF